MNPPFKFRESSIEHPSNEHFRLHFHDNHELYLFLEGDTKYIVEENVYSLAPMDLILIRKNQMHQAFHNSPSPYRRIVLRIFSEFFQENHCTEYETAFLNRIHHSGSKIDAETVRSSGVYDAFMRAKKYSHDFTELDTPIVRSIIVEILYLINHIQSYSTSDISDPRLKEIITYLNEHYTEAVTLDKLAQKFFLSKYHLCHIFSEGTGLTVHQYITNKRLTLTDELIKGGKTINAAAEVAGFNHYSSFYRAYKKKYGVSPKESIYPSAFL